MRLRIGHSGLGLAIGLQCLALAASAQVNSAPRIASGQPVHYAPIAKAAHITGDAVVSFSIADNGQTANVQVVSGPPMLANALRSTIERWHFVTPLPMTADRDFRAHFTFRLDDAAEDADDDLGAPPYIPCCGDSIGLPVANGQVQGKVESAGGQSIEPPSPGQDVKPRCPDDPTKIPPATTGSADYVELRRNSCGSQPCSYRVRVGHNGLVEWHNDLDKTHASDTSTQIDTRTADALLARFGTDAFWSACPIELPPIGRADPPADEARTDLVDALTVFLGGQMKSVNFAQYSFADDITGPRLAWAVDTAADTHRWRPGDPATEPVSNMLNVLEMPKPGMTQLIRATYRFRKSDAQFTLQPMKHLLASGADVNEADASGWTPLMYAEQLRSGDDVETLLLTAHADAGHVSVHGDTALLIAAWHGELREPLLDHGARINARDAAGVSILMLLAQYGQQDVLEAALRLSADASAKDSDGRTALDYLLRASCGKPIVALPQTYMQVISPQPMPCPATNAVMRADERLLLTAMHKAAAP